MCFSCFSRFLLNLYNYFSFQGPHRAFVVENVKKHSCFLLVTRTVFHLLCPLQALPRRRVSVAVVPKFNLLNIPGQTPATASPGPGPSTGPAAGAALPVLVSLPDLSGNDEEWHIKDLMKCTFSLRSTAE